MSIDTTIARLRELLAQATPGPWTAFYKHKYDEWHVSVPLLGQSMKLGLFPDGCPTERPEADSCLMAEGVTALPALLDHIAALTAERDALREELRSLSDLFALPGEDSNDRFERIGAMFYADTGMLRPGKDAPMMSGHSYEEREAAFDAWWQAKIDAARAALGRNHDE